MASAQLPMGTSVFLDSNVLVYHFQPHPTFGGACQQLIGRIENQELQGFTSTHVLTEVAHRLMMIEAAAIPGWKPTKVKQRLLQNPLLLQGLTRFQTAIDAILQSRFKVLTISPLFVRKATEISRSSGLLSSDALIVVVMQASGLINLASHDVDFDRVPGLVRFAPV